VLDAVEEVSSAGYLVGEDLSVTPERTSVAAQAQAPVCAAQIQERAIQLAVHDTEIAAKITTTTAPLRGVTFAEPQEPPLTRALGAGFKLNHEYDPYTDQPSHGPFEPVTPAPPQFDPHTGAVEGGAGGPVGGKGGFGTGGAQRARPPEPSAPTGQRGSPMDVPRGTNAPAVIDGRSFSGHALDEMQSDGIPVSVANNVLQTGLSTPSRGGTMVFYDPDNNISVVQGPSGSIVTVSYGDLR
jgi:hypothetical protein